MRVRIHRNLDRPFDMFGIRGKFIPIAGVCILVSLVISVIVGKLTHEFIGVAVMVILCIAGYVAISEIQALIGAHAIERKIAAHGMPKFVVIDSKVWNKSTSETVSR